MNAFDIQLQFDDYKRWRPGSRLAGRDTELKSLLKEFAEKIAGIYVQELVEAINSQRYKGRWEPLTDSYLAYKVSHGLSPKMWEATSLLKTSLTYYVRGNSYVVGVNEALLYPGSNVPVYKVIRWLEFGTSRIPARPLFRPVRNRIQRNMRNYWEEFLFEKGILE